MEKSARLQAELRLHIRAFRFAISYHNRDSLQSQSIITKCVREFLSDPCTVNFNFILQNVHLEHTDP